jgi:hypothetical protein
MRPEVPISTGRLKKGAARRMPPFCFLRSARLRMLRYASGRAKVVDQAGRGRAMRSGPHGSRDHHFNVPPRSMFPIRSRYNRSEGGYRTTRYGFGAETELCLCLMRPSQKRCQKYFGKIRPGVRSRSPVTMRTEDYRRLRAVCLAMAGNLSRLMFKPAGSSWLKVRRLI